MSALDNLIIDGMISPDVWRDARAELAALRASIAELEAQSATLTPRQCNCLCFERGFEAGREAAFNAVDNYEIDVESPLFDAFVRRDLEIMTIIESLTAPSSCGCNPLKPSDSDAAMLDEWHKRM